METSKQHTPIYLLLLMLALAAMVLWAIVLLKTKRNAVQPLPATEIAKPAIELPDTVLDMPAQPIMADTTALPQHEEISRDPRAPYEAGYEDGYLIGMDDGAAHEEHAQYDEESSFPTAEERETYKRGYREGYSKGFADGEAGKQFGIG